MFKQLLEQALTGDTNSTRLLNIVAVNYNKNRQEEGEENENENENEAAKDKRMFNFCIIFSQHSPLKCTPSSLKCTLVCTVFALCVKHTGPNDNVKKKGGGCSLRCPGYRVSTRVQKTHEIPYGKV